MSKIFRQGCQNCIQRVQRNTLRKNSFEKNTIIIFEHWAEKFSAFWPKFLDRVKKTQGLREHWDLFWKKVIFSSFWDIELKKFQQGCQYCILRIRDIWKRVFCWRKLFFYSFSEIERKFGLLAQFFWQGGQNSIIRVHRNVMRKNKSQGNCFYYHFRTFSENFSAFCQKFFGRVVKTAFNASMTTFWKIFVEASYFFSFSEIERKIFGLLAQFFWQSCQNCIIRVCRHNFEDKNLVWKKYNLYHFRILREKLSDFCEKVYGRVVKAA